jgi:hypothetical protein
MAGHHFSIGIVTITPAAFDVLDEADMDPLELVARHASGDYGRAAEDSVQANEETIREKVGTILSVYQVTDGIEVWVATSLQETGEAHTCVMCPYDW